MNRPLQKLHKFLIYVLGHRPDEFGLFPDEDGFVTVKEMLKGLHEESGWRHIRKNHIKELFLTLPSLEIEQEGDRIRAKNRGPLPIPEPVLDPPKLVFSSIRRKSYPAVCKHGIRPAGYPFVILTETRSWAERLGKRKDSDPVILEVQTVLVQEQKIDILRRGESLYSAINIPVGCFHGPPLDKEALEPAAKTDSVKRLQTPIVLPGRETMKRHLPGIEAEPSKHQTSHKNKKWKNERRRARRDKQRYWSEE